MRFSRVLVGAALVVGMVAVVVGFVGCAGGCGDALARVAQVKSQGQGQSFNAKAQRDAKIAKENPGVDAVTSGSCVGGVCLLGDVR